MSFKKSNFTTLVRQASDVVPAFKSSWQKFVEHTILLSIKLNVLFPGYTALQVYKNHQGHSISSGKVTNCFVAAPTAPAVERLKAPFNFHRGNYRRFRSTQR